jgi:hypothetical protein
MVVPVLNENLQCMRTIRMWRGEFDSTPPFDIGPDALFVAYSAWAELTCFMQLGWKFPDHVFDLHTAYLSVSNILLAHDDISKRPRKRLSDACRAYGVEGWEDIDKGDMAKDIGDGLSENIRPLLIEQRRGVALVPRGVIDGSRFFTALDLAEHGAIADLHGHAVHGR